MTHKEILLLPMFKKFISECENGKRLKKNGKRLKPDTIRNYNFVLNNLEAFINHNAFHFRLRTSDSLDKRERETERNYWKKFYQQFTGFLYNIKNCHDNYVGSTIKILRIFFNYLQNEKMINTGNYFKEFYVIKEETPIIALSVEQLQFLIFDRNFRESLPMRLQPSLDYFIFGCTVALRVSDLFNVCKSDIVKSGNNTYLINKSLKTESNIQVPLPNYAIEIVRKYSVKRSGTSQKLFPKISLHHFNENLKLIASMAGWTATIGKHRAKRGIRGSIQMPITKAKYRFCDLISSHVMRRTAITNMILLGMPEFLVRKVSGHSNNSQAFYRYIRLAQTQVDNELNKIYHRLEHLNASDENAKTLS